MEDPHTIERDAVAGAELAVIERALRGAVCRSQTSAQSQSRRLATARSVLRSRREALALFGPLHAHDVALEPGEDGCWCYAYDVA